MTEKKKPCSKVQNAIEGSPLKKRIIQMNVPVHLNKRAARVCPLTEESTQNLPVLDKLL